MTRTGAQTASVLTLEVGPIAHGGHCVARHQNRVVFVRHALPGERVRARVTDGGEKVRYWRADTLEVLEASGHRVPPVWPEADSVYAYGQGREPIGGAEFGHISLTRQRELKAQVVREQLSRLAGIEPPVDLEAPPGCDSGLGWRTRVGLALTADGALGMHPHRSLEVLPVADMPLAVEAIRQLPLGQWQAPGLQRIDIAVAPEQPPLLQLLGPRKAAVAFGRQVEGASVVHVHPTQRGHKPLSGDPFLVERIGPWALRVSCGGFWQAHRHAPRVLTEALTQFLLPLLGSGDAAIDLYAGAGLFTSVLADLVGPSGRVWCVESSSVTSADARANFAHCPQVKVLQEPVERALVARQGELSVGAGRGPVVVLDPPRAGAGRKTVTAIVALKPRAVLYISCDPATFARDLAYFLSVGWGLEQLRAFDLYPHTHHVEVMALLRPPFTG